MRPLTAAELYRDAARLQAGGQIATSYPARHDRKSKMGLEHFRGKSAIRFGSKGRMETAPRTGPSPVMERRYSLRITLCVILVASWLPHQHHHDFAMDRAKKDALRPRE
jgi:hypothetical protein